MYVSIFIVFSSFVSNCRSLYNLQDAAANNDFGVLESYLKKISKLSELFPNQKVEVQLEIDGTNYRVPKRHLRQNLRRSDQNGLLRVQTSSLAPNTLPPPQPIAPSVPISVSSDRPVYISDLRKILDEYEQRHSALHAKETRPPPIIVTERNMERNVGSLNEILKLLKKGVQIEKNVGKPTEENMSWFQIKIPRN